MLKTYVMPDGRKFRFEEGKAPKGAVLLKKEKQLPEKAKKQPANKAKASPANKAKKAATK